MADYVSDGGAMMWAADGVEAAGWSREGRVARLLANASSVGDGMC